LRGLPLQAPRFAPKRFKTRSFERIFSYVWKSLLSESSWSAFPANFNFFWPILPTHKRVSSVQNPRRNRSP
jgi:hypothetical protein